MVEPTITGSDTPDVAPTYMPGPPCPAGTGINVNAGRAVPSSLWSSITVSAHDDRHALSFVLGIRSQPYTASIAASSFFSFVAITTSATPPSIDQALHHGLAVDGRALAAHQLLERRRVELLEELLVVEGDAGQPHERVGARDCAPATGRARTP